MSLAETQRRIWRLVTAPAGVEEALREEGSDGSDALGTWIRGDARADATTRLDVYASAYFYRIHAVLEKDHPALAAALGAEAFHDIVTSYLLVHPPSHPSLRYAGLHFAEFLARHEAAAGLRARAAWATDLARFEWAMIDAFDAAGSSALSRESVAAKSPEEFVELELALRPGAQLVELGWEVSSIRTQHDMTDASAPPPLPSTPVMERMLVWRPAERVRYRSVAPTEAAALEGVAIGISFAELCDALASRGDEESTPALAAGLLERWLADELLLAT